MPRNKGIFTIKATKCRTVVISGTNQLPYSVRVEDTDSLSIGREYRLTVLAHRVENTDLLSVFWDISFGRIILQNPKTSFGTTD